MLDSSPLNRGDRWKDGSAGILVLGAHALLTAGVMQRGGFYDPLGLALALASFFLLAAAGFGCALGRLRLRTPSASWLSVVLMLFLMAGLLYAPGWHIKSEVYVLIFIYGMLLFLLSAFVAYMGNGRASGPWRRRVFWAGIILALGLRGGIIFASPSPIIDTFSGEQQASAHLLEGGNPYSMQITDVYEGTQYFGYTLQGYVYPPADLYPRVLAYALAKDVRWVSVIAEALIALALWSVAKRFLDPKRSEILVLLFLFYPRGILVTESAWTEPLILLTFSLFVLSHVKECRSAAAVAFGYMIALKQYLVLFILHWLLLRARMKYLARALLVAVLTALPFMLWDFDSFVANAVWFNVKIPFRIDSLTLSAYFYRETGFAPDLRLSVLLGTAVSAVCLLCFRRMQPLSAFLFAAALSTFAMFLFGHQAFCNYYYFVSGLLLWLLVAAEYRAGNEQGV